MAKRKRNIFDDLAEQVGELLNDLDRLLNPDRKKPARVLVPVPVRNDEPRQPRQRPSVYR